MSAVSVSDAIETIECVVEALDLHTARAAPGLVADQLTSLWTVLSPDGRARDLASNLLGSVVTLSRHLRKPVHVLVAETPDHSMRSTMIADLHLFRQCVRDLPTLPAYEL